MNANQFMGMLLMVMIMLTVKMHCELGIANNEQYFNTFDAEGVGGY